MARMCISNTLLVQCSYGTSWEGFCEVSSTARDRRQVATRVLQELPVSFVGQASRLPDGLVGITRRSDLTGEVLVGLTYSRDEVTDLRVILDTRRDFDAG